MPKYASGFCGCFLFVCLCNKSAVLLESAIVCFHQFLKILSHYLVNMPFAHSFPTFLGLQLYILLEFFTISHIHLICYLVFFFLLFSVVQTSHLF